ncbi:hypothetical protein AURDEDRAFT_183062 [Auricularia subglabra TFB-10046 SS5]|nr:hypothetical protein AURDEDRAFT_183062 [Auricularia subglabra TFB-10046 SS5]
MSDDADSLFGSRPSSPVAATHAGRSARPELALPGLALPSGTQNVGTIALPGLHVRIEQPAAAASPRLPLTPSTPSTRQSTPLPRPALRLPPPPKRPSAKPAPEPGLKRKRPAPDLDLPGPGEPLPRNLLRNHNALLGTAGRVAGLKLPAVGSGSSRSDPVVLDDDSARSPRRSASARNAATPAPSSAAASENAPQDPLVRLQRNPNFISVLRGLLAHTTMQRRGSHAVGRPPPPKKRRLSRVPSGAQDWDVPYPFPNGEGPEHYDETWSEKRGAKLVKDLIKLVSEAVSDAQLAPVAHTDADANAVAADGQQAIATSVNNWLDNLRNTPAPSASTASPAPASDSFDAFECVDSLQSLMALYDKESDESLFSTLFGADMNDFGGGDTSSVSTPGPLPPAEVPDAAIDPELFAIAQQQMAGQASAPWPTPDSSLFGQDEDNPGPVTNAQSPDQQAAVQDTSTLNAQETSDVLTDPAAFEDAIKSLLASMPGLSDGQSQSMDQDQPPFPHAVDIPPSVLPLTPVSLATPTFASPRHSALSLVDPATLEPFTQPLSSMPIPPTSLPQAVLPPPSVADPPPTAGPVVPEATVPLWTTKVEKKSVLLAQALAQRARLQAELDRTQHDVWACTVEDGVLHRLLYPPK